jgi:hypothetical protein
MIDNSDDPLEQAVLDLKVIKNNLVNYNSHKLCEMIACHRYLGFNQEVAIMCMEELSNRRVNGDSFDFESYIEQCLADLPPLNFSIPNLRDVLHQAIKVK